MEKQKKEKSSKFVGLTLKTELHNKVEEISRKYNRSISQTLSLIMEEIIKDKVFLDKVL